jgi:hypothetical protein
LHYQAARSIEWRPEDFSGEGNTEFMRKGAASGLSRIEASSIGQLKAALANEGLDVRVA